MSAISQADFSAFFREVHGHDPFPWQEELAQRACANDWPAILALPTGSGKTACLDVAVFALAAQAHLPVKGRQAPRRIFFVVNRRVIVDEAFERGCKLAFALRDPARHQPTVARVAAALRELTADPDAPPLDVFELRGGLYRDNRWARSLLQPTILTSTLDQFGSRLLFRGYGVSPSARPIHAALCAQDALVLLDEAHISRAFGDTIKAVQRFRNAPNTSASPSMPFVFVEMSATLPHAPDLPPERVLTLSEADREHPVLRKRLRASKPVPRLRIAKEAKGDKAVEHLANALVEEAQKLADTPGTIALMVNRVATARRVHELLGDAKRFPNARSELVIGRMRPLDRDRLTRELRAALGTDLPNPTEAPRFVVATQCLEVGADLDFHALVTECASIDALRQRFGRVNRSGDRLAAKSVIVIRADQIATESKLGEFDKQKKPLDPIYGNALSRTWLWLDEVAAAGELDFGLEKMDAQIAALRASKSARWENLFVAPAEAPILLPAYLECWSQTQPAPTPDPDPSVFLHGAQRVQPEINICFRCDLPEDLEQWLDAVTLLPPTAPECLSVPLAAVRALFAAKPIDQSSDTLETAESTIEPAEPELLDALLWRGLRKSRARPRFDDLAPGDTLVVRDTDTKWSALGRLAARTVADENGAPILPDIAEAAFRQARAKEVLRLRKELFPNAPAKSAFAELLAWASEADSDWSLRQIREALAAAADEIARNPDWLATRAPETEIALRRLADERLGLYFERYLDDSGVVLRTRRRVPELITSAALLPFDEGEDDLSRTDRQPVSIIDHTADVKHELERLARNVPLDVWRDALFAAVELHDWGKADERFQALLLNSDRAIAWAQPILWAKSERIPRGRAAREAARARAELPSGFRHEMLSAQIAERASNPDRLPVDDIQRALALHLIAAHHGHARPFAPFVDDPDPPEVALELLGAEFTLAGDERRRTPAHAFDSGVAERFWRFNHAFGPWGLAWIETALRLADQVASERGDRADASDENVRVHELESH